MTEIRGRSEEAPQENAPPQGARPPRRGRAVPYLLASPVLLLLIVIIAVPSAYILWLSFTDSVYGQAGSFIGLENYAAILTDRYFWRSFVNTFAIVNVIVYGELLLGLLIALLFAGGIPLRRVMLAAVLAPYAISEVIAVISWKYMLDPDVGVISQTLANLGIEGFNIATSRWEGLLAVSLLSIWRHLPFTFIILYAAVLSIPKELPDAAQVDGANAWQAFRHITLPAITPAILVALLFRYVFAFRIFVEVWLLTGGGPARLTEVLATYLYRHAFRYHEFGIASAAGWLMVIASVLISLPYLRQMYLRMFRYA